MCASVRRHSLLQKLKHDCFESGYFFRLAVQSDLHRGEEQSVDYRHGAFTRFGLSGGDCRFDPSSIACDGEGGRVQPRSRPCSQSWTAFRRLLISSYVSPSRV